VLPEGTQQFLAGVTPERFGNAGPGHIVDGDGHLRPRICSEKAGRRESDDSGEQLAPGGMSDRVGNRQGLSYNPALASCGPLNARKPVSFPTGHIDELPTARPSGSTDTRSAFMGTYSVRCCEVGVKGRSRAHRGPMPVWTRSKASQSSKWNGSLCLDTLSGTESWSSRRAMMFLEWRRCVVDRPRSHQLKLPHLRGGYH